MISPGMLIGERYEIIDRVGSGGMADVYNGKDLRLNRNVAIKILKQEYSNDAKELLGFFSTASMISILQRSCSSQLKTGSLWMEAAGFKGFSGSVSPSLLSPGNMVYCL